MIQFQQMFSLKNGNKINRTNWHLVIAKSTKPCTHIHGVPAIEKAKREEGAYYQHWNLVKEAKGYIFRERHSKSGIGHHKTYRKAIWAAAGFQDIVVGLPEAGES